MRERGETEGGERKMDISWRSRWRKRSEKGKNKERIATKLYNKNSCIAISDNSDGVINDNSYGVINDSYSVI